MADDKKPRRVVVLQSFTRPEPTTNPYLHQLLASAAPGVIFVPFRWRAALLGRYDIFHVHWAEVLLRGSNQWRTAARQTLAALLLLRLAASRRPVVRTVHNAAPHEPGGFSERIIGRGLAALTRHVIWLNPVDATPGVDGTVVLHGHYVDWFAPQTPQSPVSGRVVMVGLIRPYKGVEQLIDAFAAIQESRVTLRIAGRCDDAELRDGLLSKAASDRRLSLALRHLEDVELVTEVTRAELVVLPYKELQNSGAALLALSLRRPLLVPANAYTESLSDEVGAGWVQRFRGPLTDTVLLTALRRAPEVIAGKPPNLSARGWAEAGEAHARVYRALVKH